MGSTASATPVVIYLDNTSEVFSSEKLNNSNSVTDIEFGNKLELVTVESNLLELKEAIKVQAKGSGMKDLLSKDDSFGLEDSLNSSQELLVKPLS